MAHPSSPSDMLRSRRRRRRELIHQVNLNNKDAERIFTCFLLLTLRSHIRNDFAEEEEAYILMGIEEY